MASRRNVLMSLLMASLMAVAIPAQAEPGKVPPISQIVAGELKKSTLKPKKKIKIKPGAGLTLVYEKVDKELEPYMELLKNSKVLDDTVAAVNSDFKLTKGIKVRVMQGDGPLYDPETREIHMNLEFMADTAHMLKVAFDDMSDDDLGTAMIDVMEFVFLHEVGHALVDVLDIPVLGKEEDAVDSFATVLVTTQHEEHGGEIAQTAALLFAVTADEAGGKVTEEDYWGEHSLDGQRFASIMCLVYGSDPDKYEDMVTEDIMPKDNAGMCVETYAQTAKAWDTLLTPHLRP